MSELQDRIASARCRLHDKLNSLDARSLGMSEYNQQYLEEKIISADATLQLYGQLIFLSVCSSSVSLEYFVLVDYGGGSGLLSLLAKELGIGTVIYDDIYDVSCNDVKLLSEKLGLPLDHIVCGDIDALITYIYSNSISVNTITSYDVLEHIYDVESHFKRLATLSGERFRIVYGSGANIKNPGYVKTITEKQIQVEQQRRKKEKGHKERDTLQAYLDVRSDIISTYAPRLDSKQVDMLSRATRGLIRQDIEKYVDEYLSKGSISYRIDHPTNTCDPYTGNWCEHLMDLQWLEGIVSDAGFQVEILAGFYPITGSFLSKGRKLLYNAMICLLGRNGLFLSPYYVVCAEPSQAKKLGKCSIYRGSEDPQII